MYSKKSNSIKIIKECLLLLMTLIYSVLYFLYKCSMGCRSIINWSGWMSRWMVNDKVLMWWEYLYLRNWLACTFIASVFTLIDPYVCYTGVCAHAESVHQNCVLGRCLCLCLIVMLHLLSLFFIFFLFTYFFRIWPLMVKFGCTCWKVKVWGILLHSFSFGFRYYNNYKY